jgi:hypothetical protein
MIDFRKLINNNRTDFITIFLIPNSEKHDNYIYGLGCSQYNVKNIYIYYFR